jgi:hypothetical protein
VLQTPVANGKNIQYKKSLGLLYCLTSLVNMYICCPSFMHFLYHYSFTSHVVILTRFFSQFDHYLRHRRWSQRSSDHSRTNLVDILIWEGRCSWYISKRTIQYRKSSVPRNNNGMTFVPVVVTKCMPRQEILPGSSVEKKMAEKKRETNFPILPFRCIFSGVPNIYAPT